MTPSSPLILMALLALSPMAWAGPENDGAITPMPQHDDDPSLMNIDVLERGFVQRPSRWSSWIHRMRFRSWFIRNLCNTILSFGVLVTASLSCYFLWKAKDHTVMHRCDPHQPTDYLPNHGFRRAVLSYAGMWFITCFHLYFLDVVQVLYPAFSAYISIYTVYLAGLFWLYVQGKYFWGRSMPSQELVFVIWNSIVSWFYMVLFCMELINWSSKPSY